MAEAYMNEASGGTWRAWSAGSKPAGRPNPFAIKTLRTHKIPLPGGDHPLRSKSWDEFAAPDAPCMDVVVTVCDNAAGETCPVWPQKSGAAPRKLHWRLPDPAAVSGSDGEKHAAFEAVFADIRKRIDAFIAADA